MAKNEVRPKPFLSLNEEREEEKRVSTVAEPRVDETAVGRRVLRFARERNFLFASLALIARFRAETPARYANSPWNFEAQFSGIVPFSVSLASSKSKRTRKSFRRMELS